MHCEYCGNYVESSDSDCPACGARINHQEEKTINITIDLKDITEALRQDDAADTPPPCDIPRVKNYLVVAILCTIFSSRPSASRGSYLPPR